MGEDGDVRVPCKPPPRAVAVDEGATSNAARAARLLSKNKGRRVVQNPTLPSLSSRGDCLKGTQDAEDIGGSGCARIVADRFRARK